MQDVKFETFDRKNTMQEENSNTNFKRKKFTTKVPGLAEGSKLPPQAIELEEAVYKGISNKCTTH